MAEDGDQVSSSQIIISLASHIFPRLFRQSIAPLTWSKGISTIPRIGVKRVDEISSVFEEFFHFIQEDTGSQPDAWGHLTACS